MISALAEAGFDGELVIEHEYHLFGEERDATAVLAERHTFAENLIRDDLPGRP